MYNWTEKNWNAIVKTMMWILFAVIMFSAVYYLTHDMSKCDEWASYCGKTLENVL